MLTFFKKIFGISLILFVIFTLHSVGFAQVATTSNQTNSIDINMSPTNPRPGDTVNLTLTSPSADIDSLKITWYVNGVAKKSGVGQKNLSIVVGGTGTKTEIRVTAEGEFGNITEISKEIVPVSVDLIVESESYVPPFYKGKPTLTSEGVLKIIAITDVVLSGQRIPAEKLIFRWKKNDIGLLSDSGVGKNVLVLNSTIADKNINIAVSVYDSTSKQIAGVSKIITVSNPEIIFYENSPLYGVLYNRAITSGYNLGNREELNIVAKPYFFSTKNDSSEDLNYGWKVNNSSVSQVGKKNQLLLRQTNTGTRGTASVSLNINNLVKILQSANNNFIVNFGE